MNSLIKSFFLLITLAFISSIYNFTFSQEYEYSVNLNKLYNGKLKVELIAPKIERNEVLFCFPKMIPGDYSECNFGYYIDEFKVIASDGSELKFDRIDINTFKIYDSNKIWKIIYLVNDTWNSNSKKNNVFQPSGTNFKTGEIFVINNHALFGYFKHLKFLSYKLVFHKPLGFFGSTNLTTISKNEELQSFKADNYHQLIDNPILFSEPDTNSFYVGTTKISIAVYSENEKKYANELSNTLKPYLLAANRFFKNDLPIKNYTYLFYFKNIDDINKKLFNANSFLKLLKVALDAKDLRFGALEHSYSSLFYYPCDESMPFLKEELPNIILHELLHIITPLTFHTELLDDFNFTEPQMSEHLWLFEGVTEYLSGLVQLQAGLINTNQYLNKILKNKIIESKRFPSDISFTELSKNVLNKPYSNYYYQVYEKGALLAFLLDLEIIKLTDGQKSLCDVMFSLMNKYINEPIKEADLVKLFIEEVHPYLELFFNKYIIGTEPLDLEQAFNEIGIEYKKESKEMIPESPISDNDIKRTEFLVNGYFRIKKVGTEEWVGLQKNDKVNKYYYQKALKDSDGNFLKEGQVTTLPIVRDNKQIELTFPIKYKKGVVHNKFQIIKDKSKSQERYYNKWIGLPREKKQLNDNPKKFAEGIVCLPNRWELSISFMPDTSEVFYTIKYPEKDMQIFSRKYENNQWSEEYELDLLVDPMNSYAMEPFPSPDGTQLYYTVCDSLGCDIWYVSKNKDAWENPQRLDSDINKDVVFYSTFTSNGDMFYTNVSERKIYFAKIEEGKYLKSEVAGFGGAHAFPSPDGSFVLVNSKGEYGKSDIFIYFKNKDGSWSKPINLGSMVNSECSESCPSLSPDGKYLFFNRHCYNEEDAYDIFKVNAKFINELKPEIE